ncbi:MAG TPA: Gfo/Idh/MocA family oxidoreductase [Actinomycetes bacterium]|nr:Gfo/Idh/MocA family oxidoreductase [Actinomycetes bacterium]
MTLKIGVVGTGNMGADHIRRLSTIIANAQVVAVSDVDTEQAKRMAEVAGRARVHSDGHELINDPEVQAVLIASPGFTHAEYTLGCIEVGKPVLCEKPLAPTAEECLRVLEAEQAAGTRLVQVGFMRRYDKGYRDLKQVLEAGEIGTPVQVHCRHRNASVPESYTTDMGATDSVVHEIDVTRWLLGQEIVAASIFTPRRTSRAHAHLQDPQFFLFETTEGVLIDVELFVNCQYGYDVRCELVGETGTAELPEPAGVHVRRDLRHSVPVPADWRDRFATAYDTEVQDWVDGVRSGEITGPSAWDGYATTAVAETCVRALNEGRRMEVELIARPAFYR